MVPFPKRNPAMPKPLPKSVRQDVWRPKVGDLVQCIPLGEGHRGIKTKNIKIEQVFAKSCNVKWPGTKGLVEVPMSRIFRWPKGDEIVKSNIERSIIKEPIQHQVEQHIIQHKEKTKIIKKVDKVVKEQLDKRKEKPTMLTQPLVDDTLVIFKGDNLKNSSGFLSYNKKSKIYWWSTKLTEEVVRCNKKQYCYNVVHKAKKEGGMEDFEYSTMWYSEALNKVGIEVADKERVNKKLEELEEATMLAVNEGTVKTPTVKTPTVKTPTVKTPSSYEEAVERVRKCLADQNAARELYMQAEASTIYAREILELEESLRRS